jgi:hypothetical protein
MANREAGSATATFQINYKKPITIANVERPNVDIAPDLELATCRNCGSQVSRIICGR